MSNLYPQVGAWYKDLQVGAIFEVVAVDEGAQTIETQLQDGALSEYDMDSWNELLLVEIEEPENWSDGYELSHEDSLESDSIMRPDDWSSPLSYIEPEFTNGMIDDF